MSARATAMALLAATFIAAPLAARAGDPLEKPSLPDPEAWVSSSGGTVMIVNKIDGRATRLSLHAGEARRFEELDIALLACAVRPPGLPPDAAMRVRLQAVRDGAVPATLWLLQREPGMSVFEDPIYYVAAAGCDAPPAAAAPSPAASSGTAAGAAPGQKPGMTRAEPAGVPRAAASAQPRP